MSTLTHSFGGETHAFEVYIIVPPTVAISCINITLVISLLLQTR